MFATDQPDPQIFQLNFNRGFKTAVNANDPLPSIRTQEWRFSAVFTGFVGRFVAGLDRKSG